MGSSLDVSIAYGIEIGKNLEEIAQFLIQQYPDRAEKEEVAKWIKYEDWSGVVENILKEDDLELLFYGYGSYNSNYFIAVKGTYENHSCTLIQFDPNDLKLNKEQLIIRNKLVFLVKDIEHILKENYVDSDDMDFVSMIGWSAFAYYG